MDASIRASLKGVIFDVDGTLAETEDIHLAAFNEVFKRWGLDWHWDRALYMDLLKVGGSRERISYFAEHYRPEGAERVRAPCDLQQMHQEKTAVYADMVQGGKVSLRPGVERLISELFAAGLKVGIATTTNITPLEALFRGTLGLNMLARFDSIAAGDMVRHKKPAPDLFLLALEKMDLKAHECLAMEDSRVGLEAATGAGLKTVITVNSYTRHMKFPGALAVLSDLGEPGSPYKLLDGESGKENLQRRTSHVSVKTLSRWHGLVYQD